MNNELDPRLDAATDAFIKAELANSNCITLEMSPSIMEMYRKKNRANMIEALKAADTAAWCFDMEQGKKHARVLIAVKGINDGDASFVTEAFWDVTVRQWCVVTNDGTYDIAPEPIIHGVYAWRPMPAPPSDGGDNER